MSIWPPLIMLVVLIWLFYEYALIVKKNLSKIAKDYKKLKDMEQDLLKFVDESKEETKK